MKRILQFFGLYTHDEVRAIIRDVVKAIYKEREIIAQRDLRILELETECEALQRRIKGIIYFRNTMPTKGS